MKALCEWFLNVIYVSDNPPNAPVRLSVAVFQQQTVDTYVHVSRELVFFHQASGCHNVSHRSSCLLSHCRDTHRHAHKVPSTESTHRLKAFNRLSLYFPPSPSASQLLNKGFADVTLFLSISFHLFLIYWHRNSVNVWERQQNSPVPTLSLALLPRLLQ